MKNSDKHSFIYVFTAIMWAWPVVMGFLAVMFFYIMAIHYPSQGYGAAGPLGVAIIFVGSGILTKTFNDKQLLDQRISKLEKQIEVLKQELTDIRGA